MIRVRARVRVRVRVRVRLSMQEDGGYVRERAEKKKGDKSDSGCQERGEDFRYRADRGEKL